MIPEIQQPLVQHKLSIFRNKLTSTMALRMLKKDVRFQSILCAPQGIEVMQTFHSDVPIYTAAIASDLDENSYVLPGLGDAGDRLYDML